MESIKEIFRIGNGPSSSHTMGPKKAATILYNSNKNADKYRITLYGSLAATGKGHLTDVAIEKVFKNNFEIIWKSDEFLPKHPNGMKFEAIKEQNIVNSWTVYSVGGGKITDFSNTENEYHPYTLNSMKEILEWIKKNSNSFWEYVEFFEGTDIYSYLSEVWTKMKISIQNGLEMKGLYRVD